MVSKRNSSKIFANAGISVVIGNLIILAASVLMATVVLYWSQSFQGGAQGSYSSSIFQSNAQASEQLSIDDVYFFISGPDKYVTVYVRNFGDIPLTVAQVYVNSTEATTLSPATPVIVSRASLGVTRPLSWNSGATQVIRVTTLRGNIYEKSFTAP